MLWLASSQDLRQGYACVMRLFWRSCLADNVACNRNTCDGPWGLNVLCWLIVQCNFVHARCALMPAYFLCFCAEIPPYACWACAGPWEALQHYYCMSVHLSLCHSQWKPTCIMPICILSLLLSASDSSSAAIEWQHGHLEPPTVSMDVVDQLRGRMWLH